MNDSFVVTKDGEYSCFTVFRRSSVYGVDDLDYPVLERDRPFVVFSVTETAPSFVF